MASLSVREMRRLGRTLEDGRPGPGGSGYSSATVPGKHKGQKSPTPRRQFPDEFKIRDEVSITRHEHGWCDGGVTGRIKSMSLHGAIVIGDDGMEYEINHPRDIRKLYP